MKCPDCREPLTIGATYCGCGWRDLNNNAGQKGQTHDPSKCVYDINGRRCRMVGTFSYGDRTNWYCSWHDYVMTTRCRHDDKAKFMEWLKKWEGHRSHWTDDFPEVVWFKVMAFDGLPPRISRVDPEAAAERQAIQQEGA